MNRRPPSKQITGRGAGPLRSGSPKTCRFNIDLSEN
jgi:hypothetical protein